MFRHTPLHVANLAEALLVAAPLDAAAILAASAALVEAATETVAEGLRRDDGGRFLAAARFTTRSAATIAAGRAAKAAVHAATWAAAAETLRRASEDLRRL